MLSMEPAIKRGLTFLDRALLPPDEFAERVRLIRAEMRRLGLGALIVAGNMYEDSELLYIVGGNVDGTLVLTAEGDPTIFTNSGSREGFFLRNLTWFEQLSYQGPLVGKAVAAALQSRNVTAGRIGTAGLQVLASRPYHDLIGALAGYDVQDFGPVLQDMRNRLRPREIIALRMALGMAEKAAAAADKAFAAGASNAAALIEAERIARLEGAWDFRALANLDSDDLRPYERPSTDRRAPLLLWVAARYQGYWADRVVASAGGAGSAAANAIAAMMRAATTGATARAVAQAGLAVLPEEASRSALAYGLGSGIGSALNGPPKISPASDEALHADALLSLRVFARGGKHPSFATALVQVGTDGARPIGPL